MPTNPNAGCVNGRLSDPESWFFNLIGRRKGDPASNWPTVLGASGIPLHPGTAGWKPPANAHAYGITQQATSGGELRGRLHLPTEEPNEHGYYIYDVDVVEGGKWAWIERGGPAYVPRACGHPPPLDPDKPTDPKPDDLKKLRADIEAMHMLLHEQDERIHALEARPAPSIDGKVIALKSDSGQYVCADLNISPKRPLMANRDEIGSWERFTIIEQR